MLFEVNIMITMVEPESGNLDFCGSGNTLFLDLSFGCMVVLVYVNSLRCLFMIYKLFYTYIILQRKVEKE